MSKQVLLRNKQDTVITKENGFVKSRCGKVRTEALLMVTA